MGDGRVEDRSANPLGGDEDRIRAAVRHEQQEFLAAVAVGALAGADHQVDARGDAPQRLVAGDVSVVVVVELEVVDVEQGHAVGPTDPQGSRVGAGEVLVHPPAVAEARQLVGQRALQQLQVDSLQLRLGLRQPRVQAGHALGRDQAASAPRTSRPA